MNIVKKMLLSMFLLGNIAFLKSSSILAKAASGGMQKGIMSNMLNITLLLMEKNLIYDTNMI